MTLGSYVDVYFHSFRFVKISYQLIGILFIDMIKIAFMLDF